MTKSKVNVGGTGDRLQTCGQGQAPKRTILISSSTFISSKSVLKRNPRSVFRTDPATSCGTAPCGVGLRDGAAADDEVVVVFVAVGRVWVEFGCVGGLVVDGLGDSERMALPP